MTKKGISITIEAEIQPTTQTAIGAMRILNEWLGANPDKSIEVIQNEEGISKCNFISKDESQSKAKEFAHNSFECDNQTSFQMTMSSE